jgi:hypothetical protein
MTELNVSGVPDDPDGEYDSATDEKTAYALFALAAYEANVLEYSLINTLRIANIITGGKQGERLIDDPELFKATMGKLIRFASPT